MNRLFATGILSLGCFTLVYGFWRAFQKRDRALPPFLAVLGLLATLIGLLLVFIPQFFRWR